MTFSLHHSNQTSTDQHLINELSVCVRWEINSGFCCWGQLSFEIYPSLPLSCDAAITFKSLHSQRSPCPSIISMLERWMNGLRLRMTAREESSLYKSLLGLVRVGAPQGHAETAGMLTPERCSKGESPWGGAALSN